MTATATTSIDIDLDLSPSLDTDGDPAHLNPPTSDPCNVSMEELPQVDLPLAAARDHETVEYKSLGRMDRTCPHCQAQLWLEVSRYRLSTSNIYGAEADRESSSCIYSSWFFLPYLPSFIPLYYTRNVWSLRLR